MPNHIAIIPARKGSKGLPFKNRMFFDSSADFIDAQGIWDRVVVSTDDLEIEQKAKFRGYEYHQRIPELAGDTVSVKAVFDAVALDLDLNSEDILWVFALPVLYKNPVDFELAKELIEKKSCRSLCGFIPAKTHPFYCWSFDENDKSIKQYIQNDIYRRQDLPQAFSPHNYLQCMKVDELKNLNSEMLNTSTYPFFIDADTANNIIEVDTPDELEEWRKIQNKIE
jgi:CMP-N-acetylneuraminic acid synthetase|tara:strand:+ start:987 stop:1661 length:675 start_codon:yes stop_codon:yes gene_type:complete